MSTNANTTLTCILHIIDVEPTAQGCYDKAITAIPKERMSSFMGQEDCFGNSGDMTPQEVLEATTGYSSSDCESDQNCIQEDESGWFIVEPRMMNSDTAIHCYFWPPYLGNSCIAKTNLQYKNKNPFQLTTTAASSYQVMMALSVHLSLKNLQW